jgi:hypothetical protein
MHTYSTDLKIIQTLMLLIITAMFIQIALLIDIRQIMLSQIDVEPDAEEVSDIVAERAALGIDFDETDYAREAREVVDSWENLTPEEQALKECLSMTAAERWEHDCYVPEQHIKRPQYYLIEE